MIVRELAPPQGRLVSLDAFRGLTMLLLVAEGTGLYEALQAPGVAFSRTIVTQFTHHPWNGLHFWDLVQPFFMFIVGVAMPFALGRRWDHGHTWLKTFRHVLYRSSVLLLLGVVLHCGYSRKLVWELWNVLTQLSFTYLVAFLMMRKPWRTQIGFSFALLLGTELLYRLWAVPGYDLPFVKDHNFGSYMDMVLMGKLNDGGGWVAINCIPTTAHTMWGVLAGSLLKSGRPAARKIRILVVAGLIGLVAGYAMDPVTPIIKRICTSSFVIVSGGWCLLTLAFFYWLIDVKGIHRWSRFAVIMGMNSIFIYMFGQTVGPQWFNGFVEIFTSGLLGWSGPENAEVFNALLVLGLEWYFCYWLYRRGIFIKI
ncbi:MAG: acyltransferase family protein [Acidobacteriota bacterium]